MLRLHLRLIDFMDALPIADAGADLVVHVMAGWEERVHVPEVPRTGGPRPRPPPRPPAALSRRRHGRLR